jgi:hypothetical protein
MKSISRSLLVLLLVGGAFASLRAADSSVIVEDTAAISVEPVRKSTVQKVSELYLPSLAAEEMFERAEDEKNTADEAKKSPLQKLANHPKEFFGAIEQLKTAYQVHDVATYGTDEIDHTNIFDSALADLGLFCGSKKNPKHHVFSSIDRTQTISGRVALQTLLAAPIYNVAKLQARQNFIKRLVADEKLYADLVATLETIKANEAEFLSIMRTMRHEIEKYYKEVLFELPGLKLLNQSSSAMQPGIYLNAGREIATVVAGVSGTIGYTLFNSYQQLSARLGREEANRQIAGGLKEMYDQCTAANARNVLSDTYQAAIANPGISLYAGLFAALYLGLPTYAMVKRFPIIAKLEQKMTAVARVLANTHGVLAEILAHHPEALAAMSNLNDQQLQALREGPKNRIFNLLEKMNTHYFRSGFAATAFVRKEEIKNSFADSYKFLGLVDAYVSIATLFKEARAGERSGIFCFVDYFEDCTASQLTLKGCWHPILNPVTVVTNDLEVGIASRPNNIMVTGPNAGGKTTFVLSAGLAVLFSQTLTIVPAKSMVHTPVALMASSVGATGSEGEESTFEAEMERVLEYVTALEALPADKGALVILDEVFKGTNPRQGIAGGYGVCKYMSAFPNSIALITTHFLELTGQDKFTDLKVTVCQDGDIIERPYKVEFGVTDQEIALLMLKNKGFNSRILQAADEFLASYPSIHRAAAVA